MGDIRCDRHGKVWLIESRSFFDPGQSRDILEGTTAFRATRDANFQDR